MRKSPGPALPEHKSKRKLTRYIISIERGGVTIQEPESMCDLGLNISNDTPFRMFIIKLATKKRRS